MENSFDKKASSWDDNTRRQKLIDDVTDVIIREMPLQKSHRILDYGCGTGLLGFRLIDHIGEITFCDTSAGMLEQVKKKKETLGYQNVTICQADLTTDDIPGSFDFIFSMLVLHHIENIEDLLTRFYTKLNPGGIFCWIDLDEEDGSFHSGEPMPHLGFSRQVSESAIQKAGFEPIFYTSEIITRKEVTVGIKKFNLFVLAGRK